MAPPNMWVRRLESVSSGYLLWSKEAEATLTVKQEWPTKARHVPAWSIHSLTPEPTSCCPGSDLSCAGRSLESRVNSTS